MKQFLRFKKKIFKPTIVFFVFSFLLSFSPSSFGTDLEGEAPFILRLEKGTFSYQCMGELVLDISHDWNKDGKEDQLFAFKKEGTGGFLDVFLFDGASDTLLIQKENLPQGTVEYNENQITLLFSQDKFQGTLFSETYRFSKEEIFLSQETEALLLPSEKGDTYYLNPSREEIEQKLELAAIERGIPPVILKAIAQTESSFRQFANGSPLISWSGGYGIMQVTPTSTEISNGTYDLNRLKYDIDYNIQMGADILLRKWGYAFSKNPVIPTINNGDPAVIEDWYFAIWAYNGWSESNNPNMIPYVFPTWTKTYAYQEKVYEYMESLFEQQVSKVSKSQLPSKGLPDSATLFQVSPIHRAEIFQDFSSSFFACRENLVLRDSSLNTIRTLEKGERITPMGNPTLQNGYYRIFVSTENNEKGVVAIPWLLFFGDTEHAQIWQMGFSSVPKDKIFAVSLKGSVTLEEFSSNFSLWDIEKDRYYKHPVVILQSECSPSISKFYISVPFVPYHEGTKYLGILQKGMTSLEGKSLSKSILFSFEGN